MSAGSTSGTMLVSVVSDNPPNDVMAAWNLQLEIVPTVSGAGTLTFQDPATGTPSNPPGYIFGGNGLGIAVTNGGNTLNANDFFDPNIGDGASVSGAPGCQLAADGFLGLPERIRIVRHFRSGGFGEFALE